MGGLGRRGGGKGGEVTWRAPNLLALEIRHAQETEVSVKEPGIGFLRDPCRGGKVFEPAGERERVGFREAGFVPRAAQEECGGEGDHREGDAQR